MKHARWQSLISLHLWNMESRGLIVHSVVLADVRMLLGQLEMWRQMMYSICCMEWVFKQASMRKNCRKLLFSFKINWERHFRVGLSLMKLHRSESDKQRGKI